MELLTGDGHAEAGYGLLTDREYSRFKWAWDKAPSIVRWLKSEDARTVTASSSDDVHVDATNTPSVNLSATWLTGDEIDQAMTVLETLFRDPLLQAPNDEAGAKLAVTFGKLVSTANHAYPQEEKPHYVRHMACGGCEQLTLAYRPPRWAGDRITIDCWCGYKLDQSEFALAALIIQQDMEAAA